MLKQITSFTFWPYKIFCIVFSRLSGVNIKAKNYYVTLVHQGSHRHEKYLNLEGFLEKSLKTKYSLKSSGKSHKCLEKSLNSSILCRT